MENNKCPNCNGHGTYMLFGSPSKCSRCNGKGKVENELRPLPMENNNTGEGKQWPIIQAMIRCGLANSPTEAFKHQVRRYQQQLSRDSKEFESISEMLNPKNEDGNFRIVQSSPEPGLSADIQSLFERSIIENGVLYQVFRLAVQREAKREMAKQNENLVEWIDNAIRSADSTAEEYIQELDNAEAAEREFGKAQVLNELKDFMTAGTA